MAIWRLSSFNKALHDEGNIFLNDQGSKAAIRNMGLSLSDSSIDVAIHNIMKAGFMRRIGKGKYVLNPRYFFKGTLSDRSKLQFKVMVEPTKENSRCFIIYGSNIIPAANTLIED